MSEHYIKDIGKVECVGHEDTVTMGTYSISVASKCGLSVSCIICGENVELNMTEEMGSRNGHYIFKVCDECKKAVMKMRETHQHEDKG